ncbi:hypothetical protein CPLU01_12684 [Colletotrichum plurivorum]|uniref:BTB domain-containing protein n=1 Tax=Colletotrichum plurivorum TaxID=2175906 RepID=A0A8H6JWG5_9PEZI|nr:hypothetical protein CPLU01_12684 [Colletotrichum plurivorum]
MAGASNAYYELDPEGDLLLIMRSPSPAFAVWDDNLGTLMEKLDVDSQKDEKKKKKKAARATLATPAHEAKNESQTLQSPPSTGEAAPEEPHLKLLLSSAHLRLGSAYFKRTLNHGWKEAVTLNADGKRCIEAEGFDAEALLIVMRMIHNLDHSVPEKVDLEMMAKIAVVVDYYDCHEPVWFIASMWINELKEATLPTACNRNLSLWLLVSSVFEEKEVFLKVTEAAVLTSTGPLRTLDLPIRGIFIGMESTERHHALLTSG